MILLYAGLILAGTVLWETYVDYQATKRELERLKRRQRHLLQTLQILGFLDDRGRVLDGRGRPTENQPGAAEETDGRQSS